MSQDKMRDEFEAWHSSKTGWLPRHYDFYWNETYYEDEDFQNAWECWQASRAALVIELPARKEIDHYCYDQGANCHAQGHNQCLVQSAAAIEAAGLKVKP